MYFFSALPPAGVGSYVVLEKGPERSALSVISAGLPGKHTSLGMARGISLQRSVEPHIIDKLTNWLICLERKE